MHTHKEVLNKGLVRLIDHMGNDLSIVRNARVSYDAAWRAGSNTGSDTKLIHYLKKNGHNTPFESVVFTFEVKAPIFVIRQWHRHRTQSYSEVSARYTTLPDKFFIPTIEEITTQSTNNKQMRTSELNSKAAMIQMLIERSSTNCFETYHELLGLNCPRELARTVLPVGTYTHMFTTMNLHNLFNFLAERLHEHAQKEIQVYAQAILELIEPIVPVAVGAFKEYQLWIKK